MRKLAVLIFQTLDGVMQAPSDPGEDDTNGFTQGGWARPYWDEVMSQVVQEAMSEPYDLLLGKNTYDLFSASFSRTGSDNPVAAMLNRAKKYVVTSRPQELHWENTEAVGGDVVAEISRLKTRDGPFLQVHGSWQLLQTLLANQLIDEFRLWTFPVLVGQGKRLFASGTPSATLEMTKLENCTSGVFMNFWRPAANA